MAKKVTIELTETQARIVLSAVEEWFRLRMGQYWELAEGLAFLGFVHDPEHPEKFYAAIAKRDHIMHVLRAVMQIAFPNYGTPSVNPVEVNIASDIWALLRWELSTKDEWMSTPFQMGAEPMPKITVEEER